MATAHFDVIIIGGSVAGLSAAMTLGRSLRKVLVIDAGTPCNRQTPRSHNFITQDGQTPSQIIEATRKQFDKYPTVTFLEDFVTDAEQIDNGFSISVKSGTQFKGEKLLIATGLKDIMPETSGFADCWGISILHCPYCHGYEAKGLPTGILANGEAAYHLGTLLNNWTQDITILTDGISELRNIEAEKLQAMGVKVIESEIEKFEHTNGRLDRVRFKDGSDFEVTVLYGSIPFEQQSGLAEKLGCKISSHGHIDIDDEQRTTIKGIYAAGDNTAQHRAISVAAASGTRAGFAINADMVLEKYL